MLTIGSWVEQIAINHTMSAAGLRAATHFWDGVEPLLHNSALATRCVVPLAWLQKMRGWEVGMEDQLAVLDELVRQVRRQGTYELQFRNFDRTSDQELYCDACFNHKDGRRAILFVRINRQCPACFVERHAEYAHFANMIDYRFK